MAAAFLMRLPMINFAPEFSACSKNFGISATECCPSPSSMRAQLKFFSAANFHPARSAEPLPELRLSETISAPEFFAICAVESVEPSSTTMTVGRNFLAPATTSWMFAASLKQGTMATHLFFQSTAKPYRQFLESEMKKHGCADAICNLTWRVPVKGYFPTEADLGAQGAEQSAFHELAATATREHFQKRVFVRGVVEISNYCRENCHYCGMRRDDRDLARFRARHEHLAELLIHHRPASVTDINIQAGEDPVAVREVAIPLIQTLRRETNLGISVCLGTLSPQLYDELQNAGASIYIMKFECAEPKQYELLEAPGTLDERMRHIRLLVEKNWNVSSGFIAGLPGQSPRDLLKNFELVQALPLNGCSVSPFIPGEKTPLANNPTANPEQTFNCVAALRLMRPDWVIPAVSAFNLAAQDGYRRGLRAGANLVTINLTPNEFRGDYIIYKRNRFIMTEERVLAAIAAENLEPSEVSLAGFYKSLMRSSVERLKPEFADASTV